MTLSRRAFLAGAAAAASPFLLTPCGGRVARASGVEALTPAGPPTGPAMAGAGEARPALTPPQGYDPWIEVDPAALAANAREVGRVAGGRPILAVVKNNGYGLGVEVAGLALEGAPEVAGLAVVKVEEATRLRAAGVRKPVLLMARAGSDEEEELARLEVRLSPFTREDGERLASLGRRLQRRIPVHLYLDTGMSRMGMPYQRALPWIQDMLARPEVETEGIFMGFTEDREFDREQLRRFTGLAAEARALDIPLPPLHAASSNAVTFLPEAHLDLVRPGLMLFGAQVAGGRDAGVAELTPAFRLRARVVRVEQLRPGDSVSYGRNYVAETPVWIATIPVGHADGYPRQAVDGCRVLVGSRTYPVIGAVSASHTIVEVGDRKEVEVGEIATLLGPDHPDIHPNEVSERTGRSVYDLLMHLTPTIPKHGWS
jgi:alanine racemase